MTETTRPRAALARGSAAPRSSLWRGILGSAPVVSSALALELGRDLVVNSFGDTEVIKTLATTLRSLSVALVAGGLIFAGYRWYARRRDADHAAQQLEMLVDLDEPGPEVLGSPAWREAPPPAAVAWLNWDEAAILGALPQHDYDSATLLVVLDAIVDAPIRLPEPPSGRARPRPEWRNASDLLDDLIGTTVLCPHGAQRYRVSRVPATPDAAQVRNRPVWSAAICALLRHHADRARAWSAAVEHPTYAGAARRWFTRTAPILCTLVERCVADEVARRLPASALPDVVRITDALEVWYVHTGTAGSAEFRQLCRRAAAMPGMDAHVLHHDLLRLRGGASDVAPRRLRPARWSTGLAARVHHDHGLRALVRPAPDLRAAAEEFERVWWLLPRADVGAEVCALINLAVVELHRGRFDAAEDRLDLVFARTEDGREPGGRVHAHEITGILRWMRGEPRRALRSWQTALTGYRALEDDRGIGRCLRHLGSALVVAPEYGGAVLASNSQLRREQVLLEASGWLAVADRNSPSPPTPPRESDYRTEVRDALRPTPPLTEIRSWPIAVEDPHLRAESA
ncbi:hypothetical protein [Nocardia arizonensis]|uniref:hypothetical protein n=1 Tax=Nocardia arizonensis TaxID=1141647 RepID=UPI0006D21A98|nr:hypothetical protein [Nocardia arizonensis]